jgi:SMC interacting uncharacterized protein involved in chromosome segregation
MPESKDPTAQIQRIKSLRDKQSAASRQLAADEAQLQLLEQQRDGLYAKCRKEGVEPATIKDEIASRTQALERDIALVEGRFTDLRPNGGAGQDDE